MPTNLSRYVLVDGDEVLCFGVVDKRFASSAEILWAAVSAPEGDLELLAQERSLEEEALAVAQGVDVRGQEELEEFDHPEQDRAP